MAKRGRPRKYRTKSEEKWKLDEPVKSTNYERELWGICDWDAVSEYL